MINKSSNNKQSQGLSIIESATFLYVVMAAVGGGVCYWMNGNLVSLFHIPADHGIIVNGLVIAVLASGVLLIASYLFEGFFYGYNKMLQTVMATLGSLSIAQVAYLSLASSLAEEMFFRGALQPNTGLIWASVLFALLHIGPGGIGSWSLWAFASALIMGQTVEFTGSIYPAFLIHFSINLISLLRIRKNWRELPDEKKVKLKQEYESFLKEDHD